MPPSNDSHANTAERAYYFGHGYSGARNTGLSICSPLPPFAILPSSHARLIVEPEDNFLLLLRRLLLIHRIRLDKRGNLQSIV